MQYVSLNGKLIPRGELLIPGEGDGFFYGAGCFETIRSYNGRFLHLGKHLQRLSEGLRYLTCSSSATFASAETRGVISNLLQANRLENSHARVRIQVSLAGRLGYTVPGTDTPLLWLITADPIVGNGQKEISLITSGTTVVPSSSRPAHLKLSNMLHYRQAAIEAKAQGADDALMLTTAGKIAESSIANIFWERDGTVFTPSAECDILPGITRMVVLDILKKHKIPVKVGVFDVQHISGAHQVFLCNSIRELVWADSLDGKSYAKKSPLRNTLQRAFESYKSENIT